MASGDVVQDFRQRISKIIERLEDLRKISSTADQISATLDELQRQLQSETENYSRLERVLKESEARFSTMIDHTHSWEYWQGPEGNIIYMSPSCERISGYSAAEFSDDPALLYRIIYPDDRHLMESHQNNISVQEDDEVEIGFRIERRDGEIRWIIHSCKSLYSQSGEFIGRRGSNRDITDRQTQNDSMLLVATIFEAINEAVLVTDSENRIVIVNTSFTNITGYKPEDLIGKDPSVLAAEMQTQELLRGQLDMLTFAGRWQGELTNRRKNGELYAAWVLADSVRDDNGDIRNFVLVFSDITEQKENQKQLHYLAHYDQLTGMPNWTMFSDRMQQAVAGAERNQTQVALMFVDIDRFKQAKDKLGHNAGDLLLKEIASRVQACLGHLDVASRIGSDEFVVLLPNIEATEGATAMADKLLKAVANPVVLADNTIRISVSIGIALYPAHGSDVGQLMKNADLAMYLAKRAGGAVAVIYDPIDAAR